MLTDRPDRICAEPGCPNLSKENYCGDHRRHGYNVGDRTRPWHALYNSRGWRKITQPHVLARDPICVICNRRASKVADHIRDHNGSSRLFFDLNNLQGACVECHNSKTAQTSKQ